MTLTKNISVAALLGENLDAALGRTEAGRYLTMQSKRSDPNRRNPVAELIPPGPDRLEIPGNGRQTRIRDPAPLQTADRQLPIGPSQPHTVSHIVLPEMRPKPASPAGDYPSQG